MKKIILTLLIVLSFSGIKAQHYTQGAVFDTTLNSGHFVLTANCMQTFQFKIQLDTSLFNYVTGMKFIAIFDTVTGVMSGGSFGNIQSGDTIELNAAHPAFTPLGSYSCWYRLKLVGTPQIAGQTYPCAIDLLQCTCFCTDMTITKSMFNTSTCSVGVMNEIKESEKNNMMLYPNPTFNHLMVVNNNDGFVVEVFDAFGNKIIVEKTSNGSSIDVDFSSLNVGVYFVKISNDKRQSVRRVVKQ